MATTQSKTSRATTRPSATLDLLFVLAMIAVMAFMSITGRPGSIGSLVQENLGVSLRFAISLQFLVAVPLIFLLEYWRPARPEQVGFSPSLIQDALYMLVHLPVIAAVTVFLASPISDLLERNASWLIVDSTRSWPLPVMALLGLIIADLGAWFSHRLKHRVPLFWRFHMIHHSQTRLNLFSANRTHPIDALIDKFVLLVPFFILFPSFTAEKQNIFFTALLSGWYVRLEHSNVRTNMGPLRYVLVTPQSHRIHHSTEPEHWNSNYADIFAWDRLFGTQHENTVDYPATGVNDPFFPEPATATPRAIASAFVGQLLFPFDSAAVRRASAGGNTESGPRTEPGTA